MISNTNYKDFLQLKNSEIFKISYNTLKLYGAAFERMDLKNLIEEPIVNLSEEERENILNGFFETINPVFKEKYNELVSKNKIVLVNTINRDKSVEGMLFDLNLPSEDKDQTIKIVPQRNDFLYLTALLHEIVHAVEWDNIKENITDDDAYCNYVNTSLYIEVLPVYFEAKFCDYLDEIGIDKEIVMHLKRQIIYGGGALLCSLFNLESYHDFKKDKITIKEDGHKYKNSELHNSVLYNYAVIFQMYFNNIEDEEEKKRVIEKYNEIKYDNSGTEIFDKLGCDSKTLYKSIKRQVLKCK